MLDYFGMDVIMTGYAAMGGMSCIIHNYECELKKALPVSLVDNAAKQASRVCDREALENMLQTYRDETQGKADDRLIIHPVGEGGVFRALWDMAESMGVGITADLRRIPVRQEFIEICEYYNISPYMLNGEGGYLISAGYGGRIIRHLEQMGIKCVIIGHTTNSNDKVIINNNETRYIESRIVDELTKFGGLK